MAKKRDYKLIEKNLKRLAAMCILKGRECDERGEHVRAYIYYYNMDRFNDLSLQIEEATKQSSEV